MATKPTEQELIDTLKVVRSGVLELSWDSHVRRMELEGAIEDIDSAIALIEGKGNYDSPEQRDFYLGFDRELENLIGGGKGKGTSGAPRAQKHQYAGQGRTAS